jgi:aminomethyltransferase
MTGPSRRTPLYDSHRRLKARIVDFHGWEMPVQYAGIVEEHAAVRSRAGLFDLCHMGRVRVRGRGRRAFLQKILTVDVDKVPPGRCRYSFFLNERGTVIDDLVFYAGTEDDLLVINASNREKDLAWMEKHRPGDVEIDDQTLSTALLAVQGPESLAVVRKSLGIDPGALGYYTWGMFGGRLVSRTGYTGEDGFEISMPVGEAVASWDKILAAGAPPVGLGARDTLRTEAGMPLYGNDLDDTTTPLEAGLAFAVELDKPDFLGKDALRAAGEPSRRLTGLVLDSRRIARQGFGVLREGGAIGAVTSGTWSPTLEKSIAMAYLPLDARKPGTPVEVDVRGKAEKAAVVRLPFYRRKKT